MDRDLGISPYALASDGGALARVGAVDVEVPARGREPPVVRVPQREQADHSLAAFPVAGKVVWCEMQGLLPGRAQREQETRQIEAMRDLDVLRRVRDRLRELAWPG